MYSIVALQKSLIKKRFIYYGNEHFRFVLWNKNAICRTEHSKSHARFFDKTFFHIDYNEIKVPIISNKNISIYEQYVKRGKVY